MRISDRDAQYRPLWDVASILIFKMKSVAAGFDLVSDQPQRFGGRMPEKRATLFLDRIVNLFLS